MNTNILKKCLDELNKEDPNIQYIKGMIETLIEVGVTTTGQNGSFHHYSTQPNNAVLLSDEERAQEDLLRKYATGPIATIS